MPGEVLISAHAHAGTGHLHGPFKDGGIADRVGLQVWRKRRRQNIAEAALPPCCVHLVSRSSPFSGSDDIRAAGVCTAAIGCMTSCQLSVAVNVTAGSQAEYDGYSLRVVRAPCIEGMLT